MRLFSLYDIYAHFKLILNLKKIFIIFIEGNLNHCTLGKDHAATEGQIHSARPEVIPRANQKAPYPVPPIRACHHSRVSPNLAPDHKGPEHSA